MFAAVYPIFSIIMSLLWERRKVDGRWLPVRKTKVDFHIQSSLPVRSQRLHADLPLVLITSEKQNIFTNQQKKISFVSAAQNGNETSKRTSRQIYPMPERDHTSDYLLLRMFMIPHVLCLCSSGSAFALFLRCSNPSALMTVFNYKPTEIPPTSGITTQPVHDGC
ncbi:hypothetical protein BDN70DRAFT_715851 [Pholiota conissans]|uniref:Uncharacterized protein n=1 Tax=Pholiota conissans TaxID=109636 RepID=A0A9P5Z3X8_9AGAR|nr:hypothetical protein BDN70DRAFT_715851 [Pholiota conissans]